MYYQIDGDKICVDGQYDLTIELEFELEDESYRKKYPHFQDHVLNGWFEITIDRNKKIDLIDLTLGVEGVDSFFYAGGLDFNGI